MRRFLYAFSAFGLVTGIALTGISSTPVASAATTPAVAPTVFTRSAWLPYWNKTDGAAELMAQLKPLANFSPFSFEVLEGGIIYDKGMNLNEAPWPDLFAAAKTEKTKIYPTIAWFNGDQIHSVLSDPYLRKLHEDMIMDTIVSSSTFAGVDIDYESKDAETAPYFSSFIKELGTKVHAASGGKKLICTVEPRTPIEAKYTNVTDEQRQAVAYANDYAILNAACDQVRIMAYDQGSIDVQLNAQKGGFMFYMPVADPAWVSKVVMLAEKDIAPSKIVLGIPSYGYVYGLSIGADGWQYSRVQAINYVDAIKLAQSVGVTPTRNSAGELGFAYVDTAGGTGAQLRYVSFSDASSVSDKVTLAHSMGLGGVVLFKADGGGDPAQWAAILK